MNRLEQWAEQYNARVYLHRRPSGIWEPHERWCGTVELENPEAAMKIELTGPSIAALEVKLLAKIQEIFKRPADFFDPNIALMPPETAGFDPPDPSVPF